MLRSAQEAQIAVNASGEAIAAWDWPSPDGSHAIIESSSRRPGGAWSVPMTLTDKASRSVRPRLAIDAGGEAVAAWERIGRGYSSAIESSSRPPGGAWSTPTALTDKGRRIGNDVVMSRVLIAAAGEAVAVWRRFGHDVSIESASRSPGGAWSAPTVIAETGDGTLTAPRVAMNAAGEAIAVWGNIHLPGPNDPGIQSSSRPPGGAWLAPTAVAGKRGINARRG